MSKIHKHHIIQRYKCKQLGIDPDHPDNLVKVPREIHASIHWGYFNNNLEPLLEWCDPPKWILDNIELGNSKDAGAANFITEQHQSDYNVDGKNNPNYKDGALVGQYVDPTIRPAVDKIRNAERHKEWKKPNNVRDSARYYAYKGNLEKSKELFEKWQDLRMAMPASTKGNYKRKRLTFSEWLSGLNT